MKEQILDLFLKNYDQLTDNEIQIFHLLSTEKNLFLGPKLKLKLLVTSPNKISLLSLHS